MDIYYRSSSRDYSPVDDETDATVDSWTLDELRQCADLDSVPSAWATADD